MSAFTVLRRRAPDDGDPYTSLHGRVVRQVVILAVISYFLIVPAISAIWRHVTPASVFLLAGGVAFVVIVAKAAILPARPVAGGGQLALLALIVALAIALFVVGTLTTADRNAESWVTVLAVSAAACGRFTASMRPAALGAIIGTMTGLVVGWQRHYGQGYMATVPATGSLTWPQSWPRPASS
jgi:hypothetical protein